MTVTLTPWGTYLTFEVSSAAPDADPVWVDLTDRVLDIGRALDAALGRSTELDDSEPGRASLQLRNDDDALTPGNVTSPYYPWFKQSRRARIREIVGYRGFDLLEFYLEIPENVIETQVVGATSSDINLTVTGIDTLGRLRTGRRFVSTLAEHIRYTGGSSLVGYWPLLSSRGFNPYGPPQVPLKTATVRTTGLTGAVSPTAEATYDFSGTPIISDDVSTLRQQPNVVSNEITISISTFGFITPIVVTDDTFTMSFWMWFEDVAIDDLYWYAADTDSDPFLALRRQMSGPPPGIWEVTATAGPVFGTVAVNTPPTYKWSLVSLRMTLPSGLIEYWIDDATPVTVTMGGGGVPNSATFPAIELGVAMQGNLAHAQLYVGGFTRQDHLDQYQMGLTGLEGQRTGERVNTIADYVGIPAGLRDIDTGVSVMSVAELAGKTAGAALEEARETEQGRLFVPGGRLTFHDRRRIYDI